MCAVGLICCNDRFAEIFVVAQDVCSGIQMLIVLPNLCQIIKQEHYKNWYSNTWLLLSVRQTHDYTKLASPHT